MPTKSNGLKGKHDMLTVLRSLILMVIITSMATFAEPHIHGKAAAQVVVVGDQVSIQVSIPGNAVVGFEYQPIATPEKNQVLQAVQTLQSLELISFFKSSWGKKTAIKLDFVSGSAVFTSPNNQDNAKPTSKSSHQHGHHHVPNSSEHLEFVIKQQWRIQNALDLDIAFTQMFEAFPLLEQLHIALVIGNTQAHAILTKSEPMALLK
jgi:hypothetical protein